MTSTFRNTSIPSYRPVMDNGLNAVDGKTGADVPVHMVDELLKEFFNWRTPTRHHKTFWERFRALGSSRHDAFVGFLIQLGYDDKTQTA